MPVIKKKFLPVKIIMGDVVDPAHIGIIFGNLILKSQVRDKTVITVVHRNLQFINWVVLLMSGRISSPISTFHILQSIRSGRRNALIMDQFFSDLNHIQILAMPFPTGYFIKILRIIHRDNGIGSRQVVHQDAFLLIAKAVARHRTRIQRTGSQ